MEVDISTRSVGMRGLCVQRQAKFVNLGLTFGAVIIEAKAADVFEEESMERVLKMQEGV